MPVHIANAGAEADQFAFALPCFALVLAFGAVCASENKVAWTIDRETMQQYCLSEDEGLVVYPLAASLLNVPLGQVSHWRPPLLAL